jgi:single-stranded-DNA-specific exonuclease
MGSARPALDLLIANDPVRAADLAAQLEDLNRQRQLCVKEHLAIARAAASRQRGRGGLVVAGDFPIGIVGLLAGQLAEEFGCPTVVLRVADGVARGSARGPADVNLVEMLGSSTELLSRFGGHARAAGLTLAAADIGAFEEAFRSVAERLAPDGRPAHHLDVDCALLPASISVSTLRSVERLQPYGLSNVRPVFVTRALHVRSARVVGTDHVRLQLSREDHSFRAIAFNRAADAPAPGSEVDVVFHLKPDEWEGRTDVELEVLDWRPSARRNGSGGAGYTPTEQALI